MKEIVIKIPDEAKEAFDCAESNDLKGCYYDHGGVIGNAIKNGIPLPKGHGELKDVSKFVYDCDYDNGYGCDKICDCDGCAHRIIKESSIKDAETLVEADKGE